MYVSRGLIERFLTFHRGFPTPAAWISDDFCVVDTLGGFVAFPMFRSSVASVEYFSWPYRI